MKNLILKMAKKDSKFRQELISSMVMVSKTGMETTNEKALRSSIRAYLKESPNETKKKDLEKRLESLISKVNEGLKDFKINLRLQGFYFGKGFERGIGKSLEFVPDEKVETLAKEFADLERSLSRLSILAEVMDKGKSSPEGKKIKRKLKEGEKLVNSMFDRLSSENRKFYKYYQKRVRRLGGRDTGTTIDLERNKEYLI